MDKYQGSDISFKINLRPVGEAPEITSFDDLENVIIYAYTTQSKVIKFSLITKDGYSSIIKLSPTFLKATITSSQSALLCGSLIIEIMCIKSSTDLSGDGTDNLIQKANSGINILTSQIKADI